MQSSYIDEFDSAMIHQSKSVTFDYKYFDNAFYLAEWVIKNKEELNLADLAPGDTIRLNPLSAILENNVKMLYEHPLVKQFITMKFRQDMLLIGILVNLVFYCAFLFSLNMFAFSVDPLWKLMENDNTWVPVKDKFCIGIGSEHITNKEQCQVQSKGRLFVLIKLIKRGHIYNL